MSHYAFKQLLIQPNREAENPTPENPTPLEDPTHAENPTPLEDPTQAENPTPLEDPTLAENPTLENPTPTLNFKNNFRLFRGCSSLPAIPSLQMHAETFQLKFECNRELLLQQCREPTGITSPEKKWNAEMIFLIWLTFLKL
ncbi:hypothetical protein niasHT_025108 [Heterodera trifolii]|uniref:Uncharacterized protein n=1 Tax=Heterodera trifolii TaxID=157864 RepID=A0ABD2K1A9_9BILA